METLTPGQIQTTVYVLLVLFGGIITVDKVLDIIKKWRAPSSDAATDTAKKFANDQRRLDEHQQELERVKEEIASLKENGRVTSAGVMALLDHELHNGNASQMEKARDDIMAYLQAK